MDNGTVVLHLVRLASERLVALGCDETELRRRVALPSGGPWRRVSFEVLCDLVEAGLALTDESNLGIHLRTELDARRGGVLVLAMLACPDLRSALGRLERYQRLGFDAHRVELDEGGRRVTVTFPGPERPALRHLREWFFADALGTVRALTGAPGRPLEVTFVHERPSSAEAVERFFGCDVSFGASRTSLRWPEEVVARRLLHANEVFLAAFEEQASDLLSGLPVGERWTERARVAITEQLPHEADLERVAAGLSVTARTLQRRLRAEGTSFAGVLEDLRRERAAAYLAEGREVAEVGHLLGYASASSFHRAFTRWYDMTPGAYRERARRR